MTLSPEAKALVAKVNKQHGDGTVVVASDMIPPGRITSGSLTLDVVLGGGWPLNQWIEVYGRESHGKTAVVLKTIAANQEINPNFSALWIASEHFDKEQAAALGVDLDRVIVISTQDMEFAYQQVIEFAESRAVDCAVIDSYPALIPNEEDVKEMDESAMAVGARITGKFFRKVGKATQRSIDTSDRPFIGFFINQNRDKIGGWAPQGIPQTTPGGNGKNYAFYVRCEVRRAEYITEKRPGEGDVKVGQTIKIQTVKNKSAPPQQVAAVDFYFQDAPTLGFSRGDYDVPKEIVTAGLIFGIIKRRGAYFSYGDLRVQGKPALIQAVREDLDLRESISAEVHRIAKNPHLVARINDEALGTAEEAGTRKVSRRVA